MYTKEQHLYNVIRLLKSRGNDFSYNTIRKINKILVKELKKKYNIKENLYSKKKHFCDDGKFNNGRWNKEMSCE